MGADRFGLSVSGSDGSDVLPWGGAVVTAILKLIPIWAWLLLAACAAFAIQHYRLTLAQADVIELQGQLNTQTARAESLSNTLRLSRELVDERDQVDAEYTKAITDAKSANDQLRADIAAGRKRVSVNATCVRDAGDTGTAGSIDAGTPRLTPDAEQARADLEYAVEQQRQQIFGLQAYIVKLIARLNALGG
ncbi:MAG: hypothetical protein CMK71_02585 [Pseudomonadaceae bacterium]|nr:hypothetical protein [Pseudomonadaceae bacterium]